MNLRSTTARLACAALVSVLSMGALALPGGTAEAATGTAPTTTPDTVQVQEGGSAIVDVLANDTDVDGDALDVCRLGEVPQALAVGVVPPDDVRSRRKGQIFVAPVGAPGTYTLTYYVCDLSYLTPATLTVQVLPTPKVRVRVTKLDDRPGVLRLVNKSGFPVQLAWGSYKAEDADGVVTVGRKTVLITVRRPSLVWFAASKRTFAFDAGIVRGIRLPRGVRALPPGAPDGPLPGFEHRAGAALRPWIG